jgi:hypothetical protein
VILFKHHKGEETMSTYDLNFSDVDSGFCRVYFYHRRPTSGIAWYCLQDEGEKYGGMQLYRCTDSDWREPSHPVSFNKRYIIIERPQGCDDLAVKARQWIKNYEATFKAAVADTVSETDEYA